MAVLKQIVDYHNNVVKPKIKDIIAQVDAASKSKTATRTATVVVAASNSTAKSKDAADYVCTGSGDQSKITSALNALPTNGGKIVFAEGTYNISAAFTISKPVIFEGMGDGTQFNVSYRLATCSATGNIVFRDMKITANTTSGQALYQASGNDDVLIDNVTLTMTATGVHNLSTPDTCAAFLGQHSFASHNSNISLTTNCQNVDDCFAVAENADYQTLGGIPVRIIGGNVTLVATRGKAHISRKNLICDAVDIKYISATGSGVVSAGHADCAIMNNCRISYAAKITSESVYVAYSAVTNSIIYFEGTTFLNATLPGKFIGCRYHNVKLQSNAVLCSSF